MSQTGLAKLCGVTRQAISQLLSSMSTKDDENPLKAILDEALHLTTWKTEKGRSASKKALEQQELYWLSVKGSYTHANTESTARLLGWD